MRSLNATYHLLLVGAGPRLALASVLIILLWLGSTWATASLGTA